MGANGNMNCNIRRGTVFRQLVESRSFFAGGKILRAAGCEILGR